MCDYKALQKISFNNRLSDTDGEVRVEVVFDVIDRGSNPCFSKLCFLPFQIRYYVGKACIFNNNEGNNLKVELKVLDGVRVGVGRNFIVPIR